MDILDEMLMNFLEQIMSQWVERKTPQGRTYYCNLVTQETTWNLDDVDLKTGRLVKLYKLYCIV